jgi:hypothetical protein
MRRSSRKWPRSASRPASPSILASSPDVQTALADVGKAAYSAIAEEQLKGNKVVNGWLLTFGTGSYGTNYLWRAAISAYGWGATLDKDAVYPLAKDSDGAPLNGSNAYVLHFAKGKTPPVNGFWSITMYGADYYFYPNPLNKLTESLRDQPTTNADGSLDLYFSHDKPAAVAEANWLPAPAAPFILLMRTWSPPAVHKVAAK